MFGFCIDLFLSSTIVLENFRSLRSVASRVFVAPPVMLFSFFRLLLQLFSLLLLLLLMWLTFLNSSAAVAPAQPNIEPFSSTFRNEVV